MAAIFLAAIVYQFRTTEELFPQWFGGDERVAFPFLLDADEAAPRFTIDFLKPNALRAGLHRGDTLVKVNELPVTGSGVFGDVIARAHPGDVLHLGVRSGGGIIQRAVVLTSRDARVEFVPFIGALIMPVFCLLLGFWVAAVRPRDRLAWLLLAFLLGFTTFFNPFLESWGAVARDLGAIYQAALNKTWGIWLLLFAINFPEPFSRGSPGKTVWRWVTWLIVVPLAFWSIAGVITSVGTLESYSSVFPLAHLVGRMMPLFVLCSFASSAGSLACLAWKWHLAASQDARRRLRLVVFGALVSFPLLLLLALIARLRHSQIEQLFPSWLYGTSYLLQFVFPLSVAYVIVVQRAMDVRLIIRQSLQYTLVRRGVIILQAVLSAILFAAVAALVTAHVMSYVSTVLLMGAGLWGIFLLNGLTHRLAILIDRRFFREAYNAEQILGDLAERVRTIVETQPLMETVTERISHALHVSRIAVLLDGSGPYRPAWAFGYDSPPRVVFPESAATVQQLKKEKQPVRVYFDDPDGWLYHSGMNADERERLSELRTELLLPLLVKNELIGFMALGQKLSEAPYSGSDVRVLNSVATQTSLALEVARLTATISSEAAQRERLNRELEIAREVQEKLFPHQLPFMRGLDYSAECRPAREVGGDYYDFIELPGSKLAIAIGDISGKGIGAALMMANLQASLRGQVSAIRNRPELMKIVNKMVYEASSSNRYATFFYAEYDPQTRNVVYVNAGHNPPLVLREGTGDWKALRWEVGGTVVGLLPEVDYQEGSFELLSGDIVVLFTDGITESMNSRDEEWGEDRLIACAETCRDLSAHEALDRIMGEAVAFASGAAQHDDMTLVVLRVCG